MKLTTWGELTTEDVGATVIMNWPWDEPDAEPFRAKLLECWGVYGWGGPDGDMPCSRNVLDMDDFGAQEVQCLNDTPVTTENAS